MKKHITIIALAMLSLATLFSGCKKDKDKPNQPEIKEKYVIRYEVKNERTFHGGDGSIFTYTLSPIFKVDNITYTDENGNSIEVKDVTLPWEKEITIESPFDASVGAELTFNPDDYLEEVNVVKYARIGVKKVGEDEFDFHEDDYFPFYEEYYGSAITLPWERFMKRINENPDYLKFRSKATIK